MKKTNEEIIKNLKEKVKEQAISIIALQGKIKTFNTTGMTGSSLGLIKGKLYLIITDGRRIVGKLEDESKGYICYSKREGSLYYANKSYIKLIKELSENEHKSYKISNFGAKNG